MDTPGGSGTDAEDSPGPLSEGAPDPLWETLSPPPTSSTEEVCTHATSQYPIRGSVDPTAVHRTRSTGPLPGTPKEVTELGGTHRLVKVTLFFQV